MRRGIKIFFWLLLILAVCLGVWIVKCNRSEKNTAEYLVPTLKIATLQVVDFDSKKANVHMKMEMDNPLPVGISIDSIFYEVFIEDHEVIQATYPSPFQLKGNEVSRVVFPATIYYDKLFKLLKRYENKRMDSVVYKVEATAYTNYALKKMINISTERYLPLIRIPKVEIKDIDIKDLTISGATIRLTALVENWNVFSFGVKDVAYELKLDEEEPIKGVLPEVFRFPAMDSTRITRPVKVYFKDAGKSLVDLVLKPGKLQYDLSATMKIVSRHEMLENSTMAIVANGPLREVLELRKEAKKEAKAERKAKKEAKRSDQTPANE